MYPKRSSPLLDIPTAGQKASRTQFPLQNAFALTIHKTQGLTLPNVTPLDNSVLSAGQVYIAISRCFTWKNLNILALHRDVFITDKNVTEEYQRLQLLAEQPFNMSHKLQLN